VRAGERHKKTQTKPRFDKAQGTMIPRWGRINTLRLPVKAWRPASKVRPHLF